MTTGAAITLGITIASFLITILTILVRLSNKEGKRDQRLETVEQEQANDRDKIRDLFNLINKHDSSIQVLAKAMESVKETTERIENKLDRIYEARYENKN